MIVGKNSAKIGFKWFGAFAIKLFTGFTALTYIEKYPVVGIIALLAIVYFVYEQIQTYNKLSKK